jgi:hypothetical protein
MDSSIETQVLVTDTHDSIKTATAKLAVDHDLEPVL